MLICESVIAGSQFPNSLVVLVQERRMSMTVSVSCFVELERSSTNANFIGLESLPAL
jgi:hypothetical protein